MKYEYEDRLKIMLEVSNKEVKRKFHPSFSATKFGSGLTYLSGQKRIVAEAFPGIRSIIHKVLSDKFELFVQPQDMPWYLDVIAQRIIDERGAYKINIKSCRDYTFFDVSFRDRKTKRRNLLLPPFFHETPLPKSAKETERLRGLADTLLFLSPLLQDVIRTAKGRKGKKKVDIGELISEAVDWVMIELDTKRIRPLRGSRATEKFELEVQATVRWDDYSAITRGKKSITIYDSFDNEKQVIVSSRNVRKAIGRLSEAWHNPVAGSILLSAWTGSGKDVLQDVLTYALSVGDVKTIPLPAPQLGSLEEPLEGIFKAIDKLGFVNKAPGVSGKRELNMVPLLFLDEIHHDSAQKLREQLLRLLEAKEMTCGGETISFEKARYLFAASELPEKLRSRNPPDFWTRIEYTIVMNHPLLLETREEINESLQQFFSVFWRTAAEKRRAKTVEKQTTGIIDYLSPLKGDEIVLAELATVFAEALDSPLIPAVSLRLLRSIINRLFSRTIYFIRTEKIDDKDKLQRIRSEMDKWIIDIFKNIVPEIKAQGVF